MKTTCKQCSHRILTVLSFVTIGIFVATGCSTTVGRSEYNRIVLSTTHDTLGCVYYKGRENGFDYFRAQWNLGSDDIRLDVNQSPITNPFPYTGDKRKWRAGTFMNMNAEEVKLSLPIQFNTEQKPAPAQSGQ